MVQFSWYIQQEDWRQQLIVIKVVSCLSSYYVWKTDQTEEASTIAEMIELDVIEPIKTWILFLSLSELRVSYICSLLTSKSFTLQDKGVVLSNYMQNA